MKLVVMGANGFVGWHLRCRLQAITDHVVVPVGRDDLPQLPDMLRDVDAIVHVAGINRSNDDDLVNGNADLARRVSEAVHASGTKPRLIHANSIQSGNGTPYGTGKAEAARQFADLADQRGLDFVDVVLPNLFGEHGRPHYNSFVATFAHEVASHGVPQVRDAEVELLHVQQAAQSLIDALQGPSRIDTPRGEVRGVREVLDLLQGYEACYRDGEFPALTTSFEVDLFNTLRTAMFEVRGPVRFTKHSDPRGSLVETVKSHGTGGQTFFSTTVPGATRGDHFHLRKVERFVVIGGQARIRLRKLFTSDVVTFDVSGDDPLAIDMPTMWSHNITNTGATELFTLFWTDSVFNPEHPDTYPELVESSGSELEAAT